MPLAVDLLHPSNEEQLKMHKVRRLVAEPNSFFMDVKCPNCKHINLAFSHAQTVIQCSQCSYVLAQPTGGKSKLVEGCAFRRKPK